MEVGDLLHEIGGNSGCAGGVVLAKDVTCASYFYQCSDGYSLRRGC
jgi:hypothetical protein